MGEPRSRKPMKKGWKPPPIDIEDQLEQSQNSKFGPEGLEFLKNGIKISKQGIMKLDGGASNNMYNNTNMAGGRMNNNTGNINNNPHDLNSQQYLSSSNSQAHSSQPKFFSLSPNDIESSDKCIGEGISSYVEEGIYKPLNLKIAIKILCGLMHLHMIFKQVHRDIKPANILMNKKGQVKLTDFGVAKELEQTDQKLVSQKGTMVYMSPERINGAKYSFPSDIWSFGMIIYEMCSGKFPFEEKTTYIELHQHFENHHEKGFFLPDSSYFSPELKDFVQKCLIIDPHKRGTSIELLAHPFILNNLMYDADLSEWLKEVENIVLQKQLRGEENNSNSKSKSAPIPQHLNPEFIRLQMELQQEIEESLRQQAQSNLSSNVANHPTTAPAQSSSSQTQQLIIPNQQHLPSYNNDAFPAHQQQQNFEYVGHQPLNYNASQNESL